MRSIQTSTGMGILLITHDLGVVAENADVVAVMYAGKIVEYADVYELFSNPLHPYTKGLLACVPKLGQRRENVAGKLFTIPGMVPSATRYPSGCRFAARCTECQGEVRKKEEQAQPELREVKAGHWVATWNAAGYERAQATEPRLAFRRSAGSSGSRDGSVGRPLSVYFSDFIEIPKCVYVVLLSLIVTGRIDHAAKLFQVDAR